MIFLLSGGNTYLPSAPCPSFNCLEYYTLQTQSKPMPFQYLPIIQDTKNVTPTLQMPGAIAIAATVAQIPLRISQKVFQAEFSADGVSQYLRAE